MQRILALIVFISSVFAAFAQDAGTEAARRTIVRTIGTFPDNVDLARIEKAADGRDRYAVSAHDGRLLIEGSNPVAICKAFHDYLLDNGYGVINWSGDRIELPASFPDMDRKEVCTPFEHRLYMNVCAFGYTTPFWNWERWEREIDWIALHGFDMPMAPVATEAILSRVWRQMGLTQEEIDVLFTGPAHMPWQRMGNMSGLYGAPSEEWHRSQIEMQHRILDRMRELGIKPVIQGFAGFVPPTIKRLYPDVTITETKWCGMHNWWLSPMDPLFVEIGQRFVREWEKEFGKCKYYLVDSFNEMALPFGKKGSSERAETLHEYGRTIYRSLSGANPDAVWVIQGWMFGNQRDIWDQASVEALLGSVPAGRMIVLDLAVDFNKYIWRSEKSWDYLDGFFGCDWIYSTVPNFGGRSALTGDLEFYANGHLDALQSPRKGRLTGYGTSPEGLETNDVVYELISAAGWSDSRIDLDDFLHKYSAARYGSCPEQIDGFWREMRQSSYGNFTDNGRYRWQNRPFAHRMPTLGINDHYFTAIESFLDCADKLGSSPAYRTDATLYAAFYLCSRADIALHALNWAYVNGDRRKAEAMAERFEQLLSDADRLLASHPILRLERWCEQARAAGCSAEESDRLVGESRRLVSTWGSPYLSDYSCRIWSGLLRDYYLPRMKQYFKVKAAGTVFDFIEYDEQWHSRRGISPVEPFDDPLEAACRLVAEARDLTESDIDRPENAIDFWSPFEFNRESLRHSFTISHEQFEKMRAIRFRPTRGDDAIEIERIVFQTETGRHVDQKTDIRLDGCNAVEVQLDKAPLTAPLPREVTVYVYYKARIAADSYGAIEAIY